MFYFNPTSVTIEDANHVVVNDLSKEARLRGDFAHTALAAATLSCVDISHRFIRDVNFDGYQDVIFTMATGILDNTAAYLWLYNLTSRHFEFNQNFDDNVATDVELNDKARLSRCCAGNSQTDTVTGGTAIA
jgi:hypothetical protein